MKDKGFNVNKALTVKNETKRENWSQTKTVGKNTETIRVEKLDNEGYLVCIEKSWYDDKQQWYNNEVKLYSETNPLDDDDNDTPIDKLSNALLRKN